MKIAVISDTHLGFGYGTERENDSFLVFEEAVNKSLDSDLIILPGDIFDSRTPNTETLTRAMEILRLPLEKKNGVKITDYFNRDSEPICPLNNGIPVIAIHGTHERRAKGLINPIQALERAGFITHLHCNGVIVEKESSGEKIAIQGLSGIPDQYVTAVLENWNPKPIEGAFNIFLSHQSIAPFLYAVHLVPLESLPKDFSLYINGHIHNPKKATYSGAPFVIPGSTIVTQVTKDNIIGGFCKIDVEENKVKSIEWESLENQRRAYYIEAAESSDAKMSIEKALSENNKLKPIIKIVSKQKLDSKGLQREFSAKAIVFCKQEDADEEFEAKSIAEQAESVQNLGKKLLEKNLQDANLDPKLFGGLFELLLDKKQDKAIEFLKAAAK